MDNVMNCDRVQKINLFKSGLSSPVSTANCIPIIFIEFFENSSAKKSGGTSNQNSPTVNINVFLEKREQEKLCVYYYLLLGFFLKSTQGCNQCYCIK